ncbi:mechanosensitive ion channel domain-containing protein [Maridesulfovibrio sp.]|uniref:mechanosensitive ion channel family protein n=1 Tax=Maridesulfovibrio sp. TaxID=2795000 RepID=UPI002A188089|nr:mechanosensitive ion channel domain-containing protein [Maridesulfovibrio sp.]
MNATDISAIDFKIDMLDPGLPSRLLEQAITFGSVHGIRIIVAILILILGRLIAKQISSLIGKVMNKAKVDEILVSFIKAISYYTLLAAFVVAAMGQAGINVTSFLAVLGAAGLAVGLALKDTLSNFAAGVMLILLRLFKKGDLVTVAGTSGTVQELSAFYTMLSTPDNQKVIVPNSSILQAVIVNTTANNRRRIDLVIGIGYEDDIIKAKELVSRTLAAETRLLKDPAPFIGVGELGASSVDIYIRPWVRTPDYWATRCELLEKIKVAFDEAGISIPYPQTDIHLHNDVEE